MKKTIATFLAVAILVTVGTASRTAYATTGIKSNCTVTGVAFDQHLFVSCANDSLNYFGFTTADRRNCSATTLVTLDTLKIWQSLLLGALLAGRPVDIYFSRAQPANPPSEPLACPDQNSPFIYNVLVK